MALRATLDCDLRRHSDGACRLDGQEQNLLDTFVVFATAWYLSAPALGLAGLAVGGAAVVVTVLIWQAGPPRKCLIYYATDMPLVDYITLSQADTQEQVLLSSSGKPSLHEHVVAFRIRNTSRSDIRATDFDQGQPLVFDVGATVLNILRPGGLSKDDAHLRITSDGSKIAIAPMLIRRGQLIRFELLTSGPSNPTCDSQLADVTVYEMTYRPDASLQVYRTMYYAAIATVILEISAALTGTIAKNRDLAASLSFTGLILALPLLIGFIRIMQAEIPRRHRRS